MNKFEYDACSLYGRLLLRAGLIKGYEFAGIMLAAISHSIQFRSKPLWWHAKPEGVTTHIAI